MTVSRSADVHAQSDLAVHGAFRCWPLETHRCHTSGGWEARLWRAQRHPSLLWRAPAKPCTRACTPCRPVAGVAAHPYRGLYPSLLPTLRSLVSCGRGTVSVFAKLRLVKLQVSNGAGSVVSEAALVEVEALDILSIIEHFVEDRQITFRSLFMQFNRSTVCAFHDSAVQWRPAQSIFNGRSAGRATRDGTMRM
jgi:hypothetical protein